MRTDIAVSLLSGLTAVLAVAGPIEAQECPAEVAAEPTETPFSIPPALASRSQAISAVATATDTLKVRPLRDRITVWFLVRPDGLVQETRAYSSTGFEAVDQAVLRAARTFTFTPAYLNTTAVCAWIMFAVPTGDIRYPAPRPSAEE